MENKLDKTDVAIKKLQDDSLYYGDYGKKYLSNSDIIKLLKDPTQFRKPQLTTKPMVVGSYFHTAMLERHKIDNFKIVDVSSRTTKAYKDVCPPGEILLLKKEEEEVLGWVNKMTSNLEMHDNIYADNNKYEVPMVDSIMGHWWKGKADIVHDDYIIDIKTCSDLDKFMYSARTYNYDSQAYIYQRMFNKPMVFYVICKMTGRLGIFECSSDFVKRGQDKVEQATEVYNKFFSNEKTANINSYIHKETL